MATETTWRALRVRRKLRGAGPFLLAACVLAIVLGPNVPAVADQDDERAVDTTSIEATTVEATADATESDAAPADATPTEDEAAAPTRLSDERIAELRLGTRLTALGVMRREPSPALVAAAPGEQPTHLLWPVDDAHFGRGFGYTRAGRPDLAHLGVDMNAPEGTQVRAAADGLVVYAGDGIDGFGNFIVIVHPNGWGTSYAHNSVMQVEVGQIVRRGDPIALVGQTGLAHGPHVHFELYVHGAPSDPIRYFEGGPPYVQRMAEHADMVARHHPRHR